MQGFAVNVSTLSTNSTHRIAVYVLPLKANVWYALYNSSLHLILHLLIISFYTSAGEEERERERSTYLRMNIYIYMQIK